MNQTGFEYQSMLTRDTEDMSAARRELEELKIELTASTAENANLSSELVRAKDQLEVTNGEFAKLCQENDVDTSQLISFQRECDELVADIETVKLERAE